jgi:SAM-dependent methyltransferase
MSKITLARKLIEDGRSFHYVGEGKKRIYNSVVETSKLINGGEKLLDIGGHPHLGHGYSFEEYTKILCDVDYNWVCRENIDMRTDKLDHEDNKFDIVVSHETIEHLWLLESGGLLSWDGIVNFWREAYRVLKPGGVFYVSTRNRVCPQALSKILTGDFVQISWPSIDLSGHVQELGPRDLRDIARTTGLFTESTVFSGSSMATNIKADVSKKKPAFEALLGREFKQEELYDTMHFISRKRKNESI